MKTRMIFQFIAALFFTTASTTALAQDFKPAALEYKGKSKKFAVMVSDAVHFKAAILTAVEMQVKKKGFKFEIVAAGPIAKDLAENKELLAEIAKGAELGVKMVVCENASDMLGVDKSTLDKRLKTTKNAWVYMFELKDQGYNTLGGD